jgi:hypothetical protein
VIAHQDDKIPVKMATRFESFECICQWFIHQLQIVGTCVRQTGQKVQRQLRLASIFFGKSVALFE